MEKKNNIFDVSLDSLMTTPIEVDAANDTGYMDEVFKQESREEKKEKPAPEKEQEEPLIEVDDEVEETSEEEQEDIDNGKPSSSKESPKAESKKSSSPLTPYAELLVDEGILPNLDLKKFDGTSESLKEAMINEIVGAVDNYKDSLPDRIKHLINNYEEGVPLEKLLELDKIETDVSKIKEESLSDDTSLQKKLVSDYLKRTTKFSDTKINKMVESYEDSGDLEDEAKSALGELKSIVIKETENEKKLAQDRQKAEEENRKKELSTLQEKVKGTEEIIPGMKLNEKMRTSILSSMTTPVGYDQTGRPVNKIVAARMEDPVNFEIKLHYLFEITKGFTDFSKLKAEGKKESNKSFEKAIEELDKKNINEHKEDSEFSKKSAGFMSALSKVYKL